jgi:hypothetical protein
MSMEAQEARREMLTQFVELAQTYRGWSRSQLAEALGRDPTKIIPESGNPKLDLIVALADALDWSVGDVAESVWTDAAPGEHEGAPDNFDSLDAAAKEAHRAGQYARMIDFSRRMQTISTTPQQMAVACNRESGAWDGLGRYTKALDAVQRGLREPGISSAVRLMLHVNLANAHYALWHLLESRGTARDLIDRFAAQAPATRLEKVVHAFAHYVRGSSSRRLIQIEPDAAVDHADSALPDLETAMRLYGALAAEFNDDSYKGVANTCRGALLDVQTALGRRDPLEAAAELCTGLDVVVDSNQHPIGDWLESYGWWCIFGCNIALRSLEGRDLHRYMAVFTNKAFEIAERLNNWSMRERAFAMEHSRRQRVADATGYEPDWLVDEDDVRVIAGTMGRFPAFRETGWKILHAAKVLR